MKRLSVAALAPIWEVPGKLRSKVAVLNESSYGAPRSQGIHHSRSASAFGGGVRLTPNEVKELERLSATPERIGGLEGRLLAPDDAIEGVLSWFIDQGADRWISDIAREVEEEALLEGKPIFDPALFSSLSFAFDRVVRVNLPPH